MINFPEYDEFSGIWADMDADMCARLRPSVSERAAIPEGSFLRTAAAARQLSRLLRSPYPSVKAGVVALMAKAAKYQVRQPPLAVFPGSRAE